MIVGFFFAAVAGVLGTWTVVKPATATKLVFHLETTPPGANVMLEGKSLGVTPIDLEQGLQNGRAGVELRFEKAGFAPVVTKLSANGGRLEFAQTLSALPVVATKPEMKKVEPVAVPVPVKKEEPPAPVVKKEEPVKKVEPPPAVKKPDVKPPVVTPVKAEPKKKPVVPVGPRPASKLDEDADPSAPKSELKRPTAQ
jgi:hypothetical protein